MTRFTSILNKLQTACFPVLVAEAMLNEAKNKVDIV